MIENFPDELDTLPSPALESFITLLEEQTKLRLSSHLLSKKWKLLDFFQSSEYREAKSRLLIGAGRTRGDEILDSWFKENKSLFTKP